MSEPKAAGDIAMKSFLKQVLLKPVGQAGRFGTWWFSKSIVVCVVVGLTACAATPGAGTLQPIEESLPTSSGTEGEAGPRLPVESGAAYASDTEGTRLVSEGSGHFIANSSKATQREQVTDGARLDFVEADIRTVLSAVLGDALGIPYTIDPAVRGSLTLQSQVPLSRDELLAALESALSYRDLALVENASGAISVVPTAVARRSVRSIATSPAAQSTGYGVEAVSLGHVSATQMAKILAPFAPQGGVLTQDDERGLLLLAGSGVERATMREIVRQFDVDWLRGMSFALYPVENVSASTLIDELESVLMGEASPMQGLVRLVPLSRLNQILVASPSAEYFAAIETWIDRLDVSTAAPGRRIFVYDVQNARASELAQTLQSVLGDGASGAESSTGFRNPPLAGDVSNPAPPLNGGAGAGSGASGSFRLSERLSGQGFGASESSGVASIGGIKIVPNERNNSLLIYATAAEYRLIQSALTELDTEPLQVLIEATLAEVTLNDALRYGVQWMFDSGRHSVVQTNGGSADIGHSLPGFSYLYTGGNFQAALSALESVTEVKVISSPHLMVLNNYQATIGVGDQVPILAQQSVSSSSDNTIVNSVSQRDTGVILNVTPRVNKGGMVTLEISQEVSSVVPTTTSGIDSPTIQERKINSTVAVRDGEMIALGGLISDSASSGSAGIPLLSRIPVLGALFGAKDRSRQRTELIVMIKPRVVGNDNQLNRLNQDLSETFANAMRRAAPIRQER